jgi:hypothetical protein
LADFRDKGFQPDTDCPTLPSLKAFPAGWERSGYVNRILIRRSRLLFEEKTKLPGTWISQDKQYSNCYAMPFPPNV